MCSLSKHSLKDTCYSEADCDLCGIYPCQYHDESQCCKMEDPHPPTSSRGAAGEISLRHVVDALSTPIGGDASIISCSRDPSPYLVKFYDAYIDTEQGICLVMEVRVSYIFRGIVYELCISYMASCVYNITLICYLNM